MMPSSDSRLRKAGNGDSQQSIRDLDQVRSFLSSGGPLAFLDLPFMPLYLAICFLFHVWIGVACLFGMAVLIALAYLGEIKTKAPAKTAFALATPRNALIEFWTPKCRGTPCHGDGARRDRPLGTG